MNKPDIAFQTKLRGRYRITATDSVTGKTRVCADWFDNLITNNGLDLFGTTPNWFTYCSVGTGSTTPANTDTALVTFLAATNTVTTTSSTTQSTSPYFGTTTKTYRFAIGAATGNLSEVGIGAASNGTNLFSRALILDGLGSPTTITVLSTEALDVTYQLQYYVPLSDVTGTVTINAVSYSYTVRAALATSSAWALPSSGEQGGVYSSAGNVFNGSIGTITGSPSGTSGTMGSVSWGTYTTGNYYIDSTISFGLTDGNVSGGISALRVNFGRSNASAGTFQIGLSPALPKDGSHTATLVIRHSWARH